MTVYYGFNPPFFGGPQNILSRQEDEQLIKNDIIQAILTLPGERVMRPDFGVPLRNLVFEPNDEVARSSVVNAIRNVLKTYEPRVNIVSLQIAPFSDSTGVTIRLIVSLAIDPAKVIEISKSFLQEQFVRR